MNKIIILIFFVMVFGTGIGIMIIGNIADEPVPTPDNDGNDSGCCIDPPCSECFEKLGYCKCDEWAKTSGFVCGECEEKSPDCGKNTDSEFCELD